MGSKFAAIGTAAALAVGGLTVAAVNPLTVVGAQEPAEAPAAPAAGAADRQGPLERALEGLVDDGTLTQEQADAVRDATREEARAARTDRRERWTAALDETVTAVADALGSSPDEVGQALRDGASLADQAEAAGVDRQVVVDALAAQLAARIDDAVAEGLLDEGRAAKAGEHVEAAAEHLVDLDPGDLAGRFGGRGGPFGN